jgi:hypothetical protein
VKQLVDLLSELGTKVPEAGGMDGYADRAGAGKEGRGLSLAGSRLRQAGAEEARLLLRDYS